jgi:hypothetical protein
MRRPGLLLALLALLFASAAATAAAADAAGARARAVQMRLHRFQSCERLIGYARQNTRRELNGGRGVFAPAPTAIDPGVAPQGAPGVATPDSAPSAGGDSSQTNVQEAGVDEPDIVKSDGTHIFALAGGRLNVVDARAATPALLGSLELGSYGGELLLYGKRALVISYAPSQQPSDPGVAVPGIAYQPTGTLLTEVDVSDPAAMRIVRTETIEGNFVDARLHGPSARLVLSSPPAGLEYGGRALRSRARGWLPRATLEDRATGKKHTRRLSACRQVRRPRVFSGLSALTVLTIDMRRGLPAVDADALLTDGQTVYASDTGLYVATQRFVAPPDAPDATPPPITTAIHRFDISDPGSTAYRSSGVVLGYVLNQFALSEQDGVLRVATTDSPAWWPGAAQPETQSYVSTLEEAGGALLPLGRVGGLGHGERIFGVRFVGDAGYVVTFRQTDPLYTIDLSRPYAPRLAGELKLLGYSAYLHPVGDGLLLGIGQDATAAGTQLGTQLSLFDVSDLSRPQRLSRGRIGSSSSSEAEYDHHAFLYWAPEKLAVLPVSTYEGRGEPFLGAIGFHVTRSRIGELGRIVHAPGGNDPYPAEVRRSLVVGKRLFTVSELGTKASTLSTLADEAWVPFPQPR